MSRESEQRLRDLCRKVLGTNRDSADFSPTVQALRIAIREHCDSIRESADGTSLLAKRGDSKAVN